jgi:endonuclease/exonuclease/phosphatase family metal-dependent hydrolase
MCTRSDYVRGLQGQEIVDLVDRLVQQYQCPVFFGGDMNGNIGDSNYDLFIESGFLSIQDTLIDGEHIATEFTSNLRTNAAYPELDEEHIMRPVGGVSYTVQETNKNSIDQIFMINGEDKVEIGVFGVIADDMARSSSDHMPIFIDFSFK